MDKLERQLFIAETLKKYFKENGIKQTEIAKRLEISPAAVSSYLKGETAIGKYAALKWADAFGFHVGFLITGEGQLLQPKGVTSQASADASGASATYQNEQATAGFDPEYIKALEIQLATANAKIEQLEKENTKLWDMFKNR